MIDNNSLYNFIRKSDTYSVKIYFLSTFKSKAKNFESTL